VTARYEVVQVASLGAAFDARLAAHYRVLQAWREPLGLAAFGDELAGPRVAVTSVRHGFTQPMFDALPNLQAVCSWGVGYDTLDLRAAANRRIGISVTPDVLDDCVADLAWALMLSAARRTAVGDRYVKTGQWRAIGQFPVATRVSGKRLGILGLGRIGEAIARRGAGFDMKHHWWTWPRGPTFWWWLAWAGPPRGIWSMRPSFARWARGGFWSTSRAAASWTRRRRWLRCARASWAVPAWMCLSRSPPMPPILPIWTRFP